MQLNSAAGGKFSMWMRFTLISFSDMYSGLEYMIISIIGNE